MAVASAPLYTFDKPGRTNARVFVSRCHGTGGPHWRSDSILLRLPSRPEDTALKGDEEGRNSDGNEGEESVRLGTTIRFSGLAPTYQM